MAHAYIQNIEVDRKRRRVYGVTYPAIHFFDYDLERRETKLVLYTGSHFHESGLDDDGFFWGSWSARQGHCLLRYHPDGSQPEYFHQPIPNLGPDHMFNFPGNGPIDSFIKGADGYLYFGTTLGELYRLEPNTGRHELLGKPTEGIRLSGLIVGPEGKLLGSYGAYNETGLFLYDRDAGTFGDIADPTKSFYDSTTPQHGHLYNVDTGELMDLPATGDHLSLLAALPEGVTPIGVEIVVRVKNTR